jgi:hypothetical protein
MGKTIKSFIQLSMNQTSPTWLQHCPEGQHTPPYALPQLPPPAATLLQPPGGAGLGGGAGLPGGAGLGAVHVDTLNGRGVLQLPRLYAVQTAWVMSWELGQPCVLCRDHSMMPAAAAAAAAMAAAEVAAVW